MILSDSAEEESLRYGYMSMVGMSNFFSETAISKYRFQNENGCRSSEVKFIKHEILEEQHKKNVKRVST